MHTKVLICSDERIGALSIAEFLPAAIRSALGADIPIRHVRFENEREAAGPSVLWRLANRESLPTVDGGFSGGPATVEIECRSPTHDGAAAMALNILDYLDRSGHPIDIVEQFDEAPSTGALLDQYSVHTLAVRLA